MWSFASSYTVSMGGATVQVAPSLSVGRTLTLDNNMKKEYISELGLICHTDFFGKYEEYSYKMI